MCMTIGEKIRTLRQDANLKQKELAEKINVSATALMFAERDIRLPSKDLIIRLSKFFNKPTDYFMFEGAKEPQEANEKEMVDMDKILMIADVVKEYFDKNGYTLTPEQRVALVEHFYHENMINKDEIKKLLSLMHALNFKGK